MKKDNLGDRMKGYEYIPRTYLTKKIPVIIRLDGMAFHTFTKGMKRPFDEVLINTMQETAKYLCENIQGCKIAYTQSDEITLLLTDYENIDTQGWFEYNIQKMVSVSASMATLAFNNIFKENVSNFARKGVYYKQFEDDELESEEYKKYQEDRKYLECISNKVSRALFDSRVFSIPKEEVCNCFIWRQQDATRNSIQMVGQANFNFKELQNKSCNMIQEMLFSENGINWNNYDTYLKRGSYIIKEKYFVGENNDVERSRWVVDKNIPIFTEDRDYIDKYVFL
jgi:tRNA(His) 5'-end guanylyltransferase